MKDIAKAIVFVGCVGINAWLVINKKEPNGWLWFVAILVFVF